MENKEKEPQMLEAKTWEEFKDNGFLQYINHQLQLFGWSIVLSQDTDGNIVEAKPFRTKYRGFSEESYDRTFKNITRYLQNNIEDLSKDIEL